MLGAITGDIVGSVYEWNNHRSKEFPLFAENAFFTDDSILTVAVADVLLNGGDYTETLRRYARRYPDGGYGGRFRTWIWDETMGPYNSWGNGSAMRVSPVGFAFDTVEDVLCEAERSAVVTHNHPEGVKGAQATALAILLARTGATKPEIKQEVVQRFGYDLDRTVDEIRPVYVFNESCQETVPEAIIAFLESESFEDAIRNAISLGGDSDTLACITGGIAEAFYKGVPEPIAEETLGRLSEDLRSVVDEFRRKYC